MTPALVLCPGTESCLGLSLVLIHDHLEQMNDLGVGLPGRQLALNVDVANGVILEKTLICSIIFGGGVIVRKSLSTMRGLFVCVKYYYCSLSVTVSWYTLSFVKYNSFPLKIL